MRTYFYTIDSAGRIFHDGSELTDREFLAFFLSRLQKNRTDLFPECRYLSPCGKEMNFVKTDHYPIVFRKLENDKLFYSPNLFTDFFPERLKFDSFGTLIHPFRNDIWGRISSEILLLPDLIWKEDQNGDWKLIWKERNFSIPSEF